MKWSVRLVTLSLLVQSFLLSAAVQQLQSLADFAYLQGTAVVVAHDGQDGVWLNDFKNLSGEPAYMNADIQFKTFLLRDRSLEQFRNKYDLNEFPAYIILKDGQVIARNAGAYSLQDLAEFIDSHLGDDIRRALKEKREQQPVGARYSQSDVSSIAPDADENDDQYIEDEDIAAPDNGRIADDRGYSTTSTTVYHYYYPGYDPYNYYAYWGQPWWWWWGPRLYRSWGGYRGWGYFDRHYGYGGGYGRYGYKRFSGRGSYRYGRKEGRRDVGRRGVRGSRVRSVGRGAAVQRSSVRGNSAAVRSGRTVSQAPSTVARPAVTSRPATTARVVTPRATTRAVRASSSARSGMRTSRGSIRTTGGRGRR